MEDIDEQIPSKKKKRKKKKSKLHVNWRELFTNKLFDLFIVITGVSIAFQLNNWKLESDAKGLEHFYLEAMVADLKNDQRKIEEILIALKSDRKVIDNYYKLSDNKFLADSLGRVLTEMISLETFTPSQNTYQMLLASNGLTALSDRNIRSQTADYYNKYTSVLRFEDVYTRLLLEEVPYFSPHTDLMEGKILDPKIISRPETKNFLLLSQGQLTDGIESYTELREKGAALIEAIEGQLKK
jgi:hypothetical protein